MYQSTYAHILVDIDPSKGLLAEIVINSSKGSWTQTLDYEGFPFRCRRCFNAGYLVTQCGVGKNKFVASWWKGALAHHYLVEKKPV